MNKKKMPIGLILGKTWSKSSFLNVLDAQIVFSIANKT